MLEPEKLNQIVKIALSSFSTKNGRKKGKKRDNKDLEKDFQAALQK
jgi:hypothetical protein